ncbi:hypothetical protein BDFB_006986, partial [Asbolus verrucosus]
AISSRSPSCPLNCNAGTCKIVQDRGPICICPAQYTGSRCEHYRCSQHCKNKGMCYVDLAAPHPTDSQPPLRCSCSPQWTGERCETPVNLCEGRCFNGGTCFVPKPGLPVCNCRAGFAGPRCQNCAGLACENGGVCAKEGPKETCKCPRGYRGRSCETSVCGKNGAPVVTPGGIRCSCSPGYAGDNCEQVSCYQLCQNGGVCRTGGKQPECECPRFYGGRRCEVDLCAGPEPPEECADKCTCRNNGTCVVVSRKPVCKCTDTYGGLNCEVYVGNANPCTDYCRNGGVCQMVHLHSTPTCVCTDTWTGRYCEQMAACANYCQNGGTCAVSDGIPYCQCPQGYEGIKCHQAMASPDEAVMQKDSGRGILVPVILAIVVIVAVLVAFVVFDCFYRKRQSFSHERLQENDFNNPMYQDRDAEPFTLDADKSGNFANPVYESVYNGTGTGKEEKAVLLQHTADETPPPAPEEI